MSNKTQFDIKLHNNDFSFVLLFYFCIGIFTYIIEIAIFKIELQLEIFEL